MKAFPDGKEKSERVLLEKLSVKELRRQAAVHNVMLTQIAAAVEKEDLINLILRAGPVRDTYDVTLGVKVHNADTIAKEMAGPKPKPKKKKKSKKRGSSSSSTRSKSRRRSRSLHKRLLQRKVPRRKSRSPSVVMVAAPKAPHGGQPMRALPAAPAAGGNTAESGAARRARRKAQSALKALPPIVETIVDDPPPKVSTPKVPEPGKPSVAQAGMAAAAAMGFDVLPKAPQHSTSAPAPGLRPTVNIATQSAYGASMVPGGRICIQYLCHARCDLGAGCPEAHIVDPEEEMRVRARFKEQECHFGAECTRHGCLFRHPGEKLEDGPLGAEGQQMALRATSQGVQLSYM